MFKIVLIRHGESVWNKENRFTGWVDVDLSSTGVEEAHKAGKILKEAKFSFDLAFQSCLKRVTNTLQIVLEELDMKGIEIRTAWQLNERHYGALQGLNKSEMATKYGEDQVKKWRRGYDVAIPPISKDDPMYPGKDPLYAGLNESEIPLSENLKQVVERVTPYWNDVVVPEIRNNRKIMIVASGNSLRAIAKYVENISDVDIVDVNIPTGMPYIYEFDENIKFMSKSYLGSPEEVKNAIEKVANQAKVK